MRPHAECFLPSPACGRGAGGEGRRFASITAGYSVEAPALTPAIASPGAFRAFHRR
ncbi:hypothetical protein CO2235_MP40012 [Cupriavidus oxalaticus]|uniref:Uncharacterized protein n=1 Tax=Cupriavidus oxalaticus TaxID=96344 RepID=A0A976GCW4_9BURK|nr:hypothetical protein CO2235_MP40012 [Cupriavidus oxalaticus]